MPRLVPISQKKYIKFLGHVGCKFSRHKDDHKIYHKDGLLRPVVFPDEKEIPKDIIKSNLRTLKVSTPEYLQIIGKL